MRVAIDTAPWSLTSFGCQVYVDELVQGLRYREPTLELIACSRERPESPTQELRRLLWYEQWSLPLKLSRAKVDVLHSPVPQIPRFSPCPVVVTVHDHFAQAQPHSIPPMARFWTLRCFPALLERVSQVIVVSDYTKKEFHRLFPRFPRERVHRVYHGIHRRFRPLSSEQKAALRKERSVERPMLLSVATVEPRKNLSRLLRAFASIQDNIPHELVIVGADGAYNEVFYEELKSAQGQSRVRLLGARSPDELVGWYNLADAFVFPSLYEGFGFPVLEAQACGCPVVCADTTSLGEIAGGAAWLVRPRSVRSIADGILASLRSEERSARRAAGLEHAACFDWERCVSETLRVYEAALS